MRFMLDTNICIYLLNRTFPHLLERLTQHPPTHICVSSITAGELWYGGSRSSRKKENARRLELLLSELAVAPFDEKASRTYGVVRHGLASSGRTIGPLDTLIAAHALSLKHTLVTNNERELRRVRGLAVENWAA